VKALDLAGQRFGRLTVLARVENNSNGQSYWRCICDCGNHCIVCGAHLRAGASRSCGCSRLAANTVHGMCGTPEYRAYYNMIKRCEYVDDNAFANYGGRGIKVCERWRGSFEAFLADMGRRPSKRHSIDRIDVNGDYGPDNCRWAVVETQERNKRVRRDSPVGVRGVAVSKAGNYIAQIYVEGRMIRIGTYLTIDEARQARRKAEEKYWREEVMPS
jgi:hypothetical protein